MTLQVLVAAMHQDDHALPEKMNLQTDALIGNQCDRNAVEEFDYHGHCIRYYSFAERGVGLNRNTTLMRASADIVLFADADVVYADGYADTVLRAYAEHPKADVILFNMKMSYHGEPPHDVVLRSCYVGRRAISRFGTVCISARTRALKRANVTFHRMFGGGAEFGSGEDTIFLQDCVRKGLRVFACAQTLGCARPGTSTWFEGYTDKYFFDKGVLFYYLYPRLAGPLVVYHALKHRQDYAPCGVCAAVTRMRRGVCSARSGMLL